MPSFQKIKSSRVNNASANVYVGNAGTMFFNSDTGALRLSDGVTPGGAPVTVAIAGNITFGNISVTDTTISTINPNADLNLQSNGTGDVNLVGNVKAFTTNANIQTSIPIFSINYDGQVQMLVPGADTVAGALEIVGNDTGLFHPPNQSGVILHVTGNQGMQGRNYFDANDNYPILVGRRYNGTAANISQVLNNQLFFRIAGQGSTNTGFETFGPCQIDWVATEDQTPTTQGGELRIRATPNGSNAVVGITQVAAFNATTGVTSNIGFVGNLTGNINSGNVIPVTDNLYFSGTATNRWRGVYSGTAGLHVQDTVSGTNANITVTNGVMYLNGVVGLTTGNLYFENNTILSLLPNVDIVMGNVQGTDTGNILMNRVTNFTRNVTTSGNVIASGNVSAASGNFAQFHGKYIRNIRDAGTIADGGNLTVDMSTDALVYCTWGNGMNMVYTNFTTGSVVRVMATKTSGTGTDAISLDGVTASHTSSGTTSVTAAADTTTFLELTSTNGNIAGLYIKL